MSDDQEFPPLPGIVTIPQPTMDRWAEIPDSAYLNIAISKADMTRLYTAFEKSMKAEEQLHDSLIVWSQGDLSKANVLSDAARRSRVDAWNSFVQFFGAIMAGATRAK